MSSSSIDSSPATTSPLRPAPATPSLPRRLFLFVLLGCLTLGGGRIASSDGNTQFALAASLLRGRLDIPEGWNGRHGRGGLFYAKADPGLACLALPWVAAGQASAALLPAGGAWRAQWPRIVTSTFNAVVSAGAALAFLLLVRSLGYSPRTALVMSLGLAFATPLLVYSKSFMREPLLMLSLLLAVLDVRRNAWRRAGLWLAAGMLVKSSMVLQVPLVAWLCAGRQRQSGAAAGGAVRQLLVGPIAAAGLLALYNWLRFESVTRTGYDPTVDNFSTPLLVGLYGQLLSPGKSLFLYAPLGAVALWGYRGLLRHHGAEGRFALAVVVANLIFHAKFASWAGEGSWGPRYLVPFLPWLILPAAELVQSGRIWARRAAGMACILGLVAQLGGSAIYFGSYMRELGEYPYTRNFSDPLFMVRSHFVPNDSPLVGHWRLLARNGRLLLSDERPLLVPTAEAAGRLPLDPEDRDQLRYVIDLWFCYGIYAGLRPAVMVALFVLALAATAAAGVALRAAARAAAAALPAPPPG